MTVDREELVTLALRAAIHYWQLGAGPWPPEPYVQEWIEEAERMIAEREGG